MVASGITRAAYTLHACYEMAAAPLVITDSENNRPSIDGIFSGLSFFLTQRLPSRARFVSDIQANGGRVVKLEKQANYIICDHLRKDIPAGGYSYKLIETALKDGRFPEPSTYATAAKTGPAREVGSATATKSTRTPFTPEDDQVLWDWVKRAEAAGGSAKGNEIYKELEAINSRHTFQSWRSRYIKIFAGNPPPRSSTSHNGSATPPVLANSRGRSDNAHAAEALARLVGRDNKRKFDGSAEPSERDDGHKPRKSKQQFTKDDFNKLLAQANDIQKVDESQAQDAWNAWAEGNSTHSAAEWRRFYEEAVLPWYLEHDKARDILEQPTSADGEGDRKAERGKRAVQYPPSQDNGHESNLHDVIHSPNKVALENGNSLEDQLLAASMAQSPSTPALAVRSVNGRAEENLLTSDANEAADQQLQRELTQSPRILRDLPLEDMLPMSQESQIGDNEPDLSASSGPALTEANLATQQAHHDATVMRGMDLPEDDQMHDQSDYIDYLKATLSTPRAKNVLASQLEIDINAGQGDTSKGQAPAAKPPVTTTNSQTESQLMLSKPNQDIDYSHIFADDMPWPSSMDRSSGQHDETRPALEDHRLSMHPSFDESATVQDRTECDYEFDLGFDLTEMPEPDGGFQPDLTPRQHDRTSKSRQHGIRPDIQAGKGPTSLRTPNNTGRASSIISVSSVVTSSLSAQSAQRSIPNEVLETQDIYNAETQYPQLTIPLPDLPEEIGDEVLDDESPAPIDRSHDGTTDNADDMGAWMSKMQRKGYDDGQIIESLQCTSMRPDLAEYVLLARQRGEGIPSGVPGVWTAIDDVDLEGGDARRLRALQEKHGWDECVLRREFLDQYRGLA